MSTATRLDLEAFVAGEYPRVVSAVRLITGNYDLAADAVQDAIVGLLAKPPKTEPHNYAAYITVVASNKARDILRRRGAERRAHDKLAPAREHGADALSGLDLDVIAALRGLPARQREICIMHYLMDHSVGQIADGMGVSTGTVKTQLHRARHALATRIGSQTAEGEARFARARVNLQ